jgi:hypothetical protein
LTDEEFTAELNRKYEMYKAGALRVLAEHPGPCVVKYWVYGSLYKKPFPKLEDAYRWIGKREWAGEQATQAIILDNGFEYDVSENIPLRAGSLFDE